MYEIENICGKSCIKIREDEKGTYYMLTDTLFTARFGKDNNYSASDVRKLLQECAFAEELQKEYGDKLVPITTDLLSWDGFDDYGTVNGDVLALRTVELHKEWQRNIPNDSDSEWLATPYGTRYNKDGVCVYWVNQDGVIDIGHCKYPRDVRPFFILKKN